MPANAFNTEVQASEQSPYWTEQLKQFAKLSKQKAVEHALSPMVKRAKLAKFAFRHAGIHLGQPVAAHVVAFLPAESRSFVERKHVLAGVHRCRDAQLVVLDTIARLHEILPADASSVIHMIYIMGLGKQVTTLDSWTHLRGDFSTQGAARSVIKHQAVSETTRVEFVLAQNFKNAYPEVIAALRACVSPEKSKWSIVRELSARPGVSLKQVHVNSLSGLWEWLQLHRRIVNARGKAKVWCEGGGG